MCNKKYLPITWRKMENEKWYNNNKAEKLFWESHALIDKDSLDCLVFVFGKPIIQLVVVQLLLVSPCLPMSSPPFLTFFLSEFCHILYSSTRLTSLLTDRPMEWERKLSWIWHLLFVSFLQPFFFQGKMSAIQIRSNTWICTFLHQRFFLPDTRFYVGTYIVRRCFGLSVTRSVNFLNFLMFFIKKFFPSVPDYCTRRRSWDIRFCNWFPKYPALRISDAGNLNVVLSVINF